MSSTLSYKFFGSDPVPLKEVTPCSSCKCCEVVKEYPATPRNSWGIMMQETECSEGLEMGGGRPNMDSLCEASCQKAGRALCPLYEHKG